jgi:DNA-binding CsgD family transcriptional regulator
VAIRDRDPRGNEAPPPGLQTVHLDDLIDHAAEPSRRFDDRLELIASAQELSRAHLRPREARLVGLRAAGYSREQIAELTGDSCRTVERQLGRAQRKLRVARGGDAEVR